MKTFDTEAQMSLQTLAVGSNALTRGRNAAGDGLSSIWLIQSSGVGVDLDGGGVAVLQKITSDMVTGGGGGGGAVDSVSAASGVLVTGTAADPIVGTNYSILTSSPGPTDGIDGQVFFVVDP